MKWELFIDLYCSHFSLRCYKNVAIRNTELGIGASAVSAVRPKLVSGWGFCIV